MVGATGEANTKTAGIVGNRGEPRQPSSMPLQVAYLVNQYPKVSHTFIRREILALERQGLTVRRVAVRGWKGSLTDPQDEVERTQTAFLLRHGALALLVPLIQSLLESPMRFISAAALALRTGRSQGRSVLYRAAYLAEACLMLRWLKAWRIQHVHAHFGTNSAQVAMLVNALGGPSYSFTVHGPEEFDMPQSLALAEKVRRSAFVVAISSFSRSQIFRWVESRHWAKVHVVHCGLEPAFHAGMHRPAPTERRFVCVGRLCEQKGQLLLLEAAGLLKSRGVPFNLVLAGDGEMRPEIEAAILRLGIGAQVRITGWISSAEVRDELLAARALVLPSFAEGLPVVIMEAMALRRPVLSTYIAGIPELVLPGECGWLFPAGDVESLAAAMMECLEAPQEVLARMGDAARARVLLRHDADTEALKLAALFGQVLAPARNLTTP